MDVDDRNLLVQPYRITLIQSKEKQTESFDIRDLIVLYLL